MVRLIENNEKLSKTSFQFQQKREKSSNSLKIMNEIAGKSIDFLSHLMNVQNVHSHTKNINS